MTGLLIVIVILAARSITRFFFADARRSEEAQRVIDDRKAYFAQRDPHCDGCSLALNQEPVSPVMRCAMHCSCVAGLVGDPLFGFDFEKYRER